MSGLVLGILPEGRPRTRLVRESRSFKMPRTPVSCSLVAGVVAVFAWGCGGAGTPPVESSRTEAKVSGTVKIRGKAATKGKVTFDPSNIRRKDVAPSTAAIGKDGTYTITTLIGENSVFVETPETERDSRLGSNVQNLNVQVGDNTFDIQIPPPQQ